MVNADQIKRMQDALEVKAFTIYDRKAKTFTNPIYRKNAEDAQRAFQNLLTNEQDMVSLHPDDFDLFECGSWNPIVGQLQGYSEKIFVCNAGELKRTVDKRKK